jgi:hypothetical protein
MKTLVVTFILLLFNISSYAQSKLDTIQWRPDYKLKWVDFQGNIKNIRWVANTAYDFDYFRKYYNNNVLYYTKSYFYKNLSWVDTVFADSFTLVHEQGHFDICEVYSRKLMAELKANYSITSNESDFPAIYQNVRIECNQMEEQYDLETLHGTNRTT